MRGTPVKTRAHASRVPRFPHRAGRRRPGCALGRDLGRSPSPHFEIHSPVYICLHSEAAQGIFTPHFNKGIIFTPISPAQPQRRDGGFQFETEYLWSLGWAVPQPAYPNSPVRPQDSGRTSGGELSAPGPSSFFATTSCSRGTIVPSGLTSSLLRIPSQNQRGKLSYFLVLFG